MQKKSFVDIFVVSAGNGINAIFGLLFFTAIARNLSLEDFGKYALLTSLLVSLSKIMDFGTNSVFVAETISQNKSYINKLFSIKLLLLVVTVVISFTFLYFLHLLNFLILVTFILGLVGYGVNILYFAYFQSMQKFYHAVSLNFIPALIKALCALLIFFGVLHVNLNTSFLIFSGSIVSSILLTFFLSKEYKSPTFNLAGVKELFIESVPAGLSQLTKEGWSAIGNIIVKLTNTFSEVGIYSLAGKIADIFSLVSLSIFTVLLPKNAKRKAANAGYNYKETALIAVGILGFAFLTAVAATYLVEPIFGEKFTSSLNIIHILIFAAAISAIHNFMDNYFYIEKKTHVLLNITLVKLGSFILLGTIWSHKFSIEGLSWANLSSALIALVLTASFLFKSK